MTFEESIKLLPTWAQILLLLLSLPSIVSIIALVRSWSMSSSASKLKELENQYAQIMSDRDERLSNTAIYEKMAGDFATMYEGLMSLHRTELAEITGAISVAARVNRENDTANRKALENNTSVMQDFSQIMRGISERWESVDNGLREVASVSKQVIAISNELNNISNALHVDVRKQIEFFETVRSMLAALKLDIQETAKKGDLINVTNNFGEIYDDLEKAVQDLSLVIQRRTETQPIPDIEIKEDNELNVVE